ncbi:3-hydroxy-3-methylglutaryl-coenzyme A reductase [Sulfurivirga caldicuralii]|uniref:3-hydroxy-3-methylglutaryl-coenzyme A reductase n=1 Tax=Sulfurivirga caldicuralii TaxID=364032 RepID=A0A1N6G9Z3_9GAMM|nr:hydroxymethylglutaryl-CoA reductase [Sulfurivirga caldicuralii]SIO04242.1 3-hydroxy-3-methylglutaryl-coenzyme A reductase [Sulfurivirga caldicuralii]
MQFAQIPMQWVGPLLLRGDIEDRVEAPMATYETPLWPSVNRGARVTEKAGGIRITLIDARMSRSITLQAVNAHEAHQAAQAILEQQDRLQAVVSQSSRFARLIEIHPKIIGNLLILRLEFTTGDASGHNMVTHAADQLIPWLLQHHPQLRYVSISGNFCTDKKVSAVNALHGRGKNVVAETWLPEKLVRRYLKTTPEKLVELHIKKNLLGSIAAGSLMSANAHAANMLLAFYLATGQDAANIVEGSQCIDHAEVHDNGDLYFSTTLPNLIVGTVGNGKGLDFVQENLARMGCTDPDALPGENARRLAGICAATVLCGELSLLAAQTNPGELMAAHLKLERKGS